MSNLKPSLISKNEKNRLHESKRPIIGLTGGIATGKSTVANLLRKEGLTVLDADLLVKEIYKTQEAKDFISTNWPMAMNDKEIIFPKLRELFFQDMKIKQEIESFIYSRLPHAFITESLKSNQSFIIYDVPLLFEKELYKLVDQSVVVYSPREIQLQRLIQRDNITEDLANKILDQQMGIEEKVKKADFIIKNAASEKELAAEVKSFLLQVLA